MGPSARRPLFFVGASWKDLKRLPGHVQDIFGTLLLDVQYGERPSSAVPLRGFGGAGVLEIVEDFDRATYRAIYTVNFPRAVYVLHVFQKKSRRGIETPKQELDLVRSRYERARAHYATLPAPEEHDA